MKRSISQIDEKERQALFDTFVEKGGKVVEEASLRKALLEKERTNKPPLKQRVTSSGSKMSEESTSVPKTNVLTKGILDLVDDFQKKDVVRKTVLEPSKKEAQVPGGLGGFPLFFKRLVAFLGGITDFSGRAIQPGFCKETYLVLKEVLESLKLVTNFLLKSPLFRRADLIRAFAERYPIFTEIILRINSLKMEQVMARFLPNRAISLVEAKNYYLLLIRNFFPFWGRKTLILGAFEQAFKVLQQLKDYSHEELSRHHKIVSRDVNRLFDAYFSKLEKLYPLITGKDIDVISPASVAILELGPIDFLGSWGVTIQKIINPSGENEEEDSAEKLEDDFEQEGFQNSLQEIYDLKFPENKIAPDLLSYPRNDKIFILSSLLDYCVEQFWILNNGKYIVYRPLQEGGQRFSLELVIQDFFMNVEKFRASVKNYSQILSALTSFTKDLSTEGNTDPLYTMSKDEESLRNMRSKLSRQLRDQAVGIIESVTSPMTPRMGSLPKYLQDPDVKLEMKGELSANSIGGTPLGILEGFYYFLLACHYLLKNGKLSGMGSTLPVDSALSNLYISSENITDEEKQQ